MKITMLQKGYRINVSDAEMAVLERTVREGMGSPEWSEEKWQRDYLPPDEKRIMTEIETGKRDWMVVTNVRRS